MNSVAFRALRLIQTGKMTPDKTDFPSDKEFKIFSSDEQGRPIYMKLAELPFFDVAFDEEHQTNVWNLSELDGYSWRTFFKWARKRRTCYEILGAAWIWWHTNTTAGSLLSPDAVQCTGLLELTLHDFSRHVWNYAHWINIQCQHKDQTLEPLEKDPSSRFALAEMAQLIFWTFECFKFDIGNGTVQRSGRDTFVAWRIKIAHASRDSFFSVAQDFRAVQHLRRHIQNQRRTSDYEELLILEMDLRAQMIISKLPASSRTERRECTELIKKLGSECLLHQGQSEKYIRMSSNHRERLLKLMLTNDCCAPIKKQV